MEEREDFRHRELWGYPEMLEMIGIGRDGRRTFQAEGPLQAHIEIPNTHILF